MNRCYLTYSQQYRLKMKHFESFRKWLSDGDETDDVWKVEAEYPAMYGIPRVYYSAGKFSLLTSIDRGVWDVTTHSDNAIAVSYCEDGTARVLHYKNGIFDVGVMLSHGFIKDIGESYMNSDVSISESGKYTMTMRRAEGGFLLAVQDWNIMLLTQKMLHTIINSIDKPKSESLMSDVVNELMSPTMWYVEPSWSDEVPKMEDDDFTSFSWWNDYYKRTDDILAAIDYNSSDKWKFKIVFGGTDG